MTVISGTEESQRFYAGVKERFIRTSVVGLQIPTQGGIMATIRKYIAKERQALVTGSMREKMVEYFTTAQLHAEREEFAEAQIFLKLTYAAARSCSCVLPNGYVALSKRVYGPLSIPPHPEEPPEEK